jgi:hypothetical protein
VKQTQTRISERTHLLINVGQLLAEFFEVDNDEDVIEGSVDEHTLLSDCTDIVLRYLRQVGARTMRLTSVLLLYTASTVPSCPCAGGLATTTTALPCDTQTAGHILVCDQYRPSHEKT